VFSLRKFYTTQIFLLVRMQLRKHVDTQPVKRLTLLTAIRNFASILKNEISLRSWSGGTAHLPT